MKSPLSVTNLTKSYASVTAVKDVSLELHPGEVFGLLGPNGAGKTSLISCIVGLEAASTGSIVVNGFDVVKDSLKSRRQIGFVPQEVVNHGFFDVQEILEFHSGYYGISKNQERIEELLEELHLKEHRHKKVRQLSGGMKRRLMIAKALVHKPKLLLLDEPTAGVDIELRESLWRFVKRLKAEGMTILLTTHHLEEAERLCDRVGIIHHGEIKRIGLTGDLIKELTHRAVHIKKTNGENLVFKMKVGDRVGQLLKEKCSNLEDIVDISITEGTLEEAFKQVIGGHQ